MQHQQSANRLSHHLSVCSTVYLQYRTYKSACILPYTSAEEDAEFYINLTLAPITLYEWPALLSTDIPSAIAAAAAVPPPPLPSAALLQ
jgi:hypothetical protein